MFQQFDGLSYRCLPGRVREKSHGDYLLLGEHLRQPPETPLFRRELRNERRQALSILEELQGARR